MLWSLKEPVISFASQIEGVRPAVEDKAGGRTERDLDVIDPIDPCSAASADERRQDGGHPLESDFKHLGLRHDNSGRRSLILRWALSGRMQPVWPPSCAEDRLRPACVDVGTEEGGRRWKLGRSLKKKTRW